MLKGIGKSSRANEDIGCCVKIRYTKSEIDAEFDHVYKRSSIEKITVTELKKELKQHKLTQGGRRIDLIRRLARHYGCDHLH